MISRFKAHMGTLTAYDDRYPARLALWERLLSIERSGLTRRRGSLLNAFDLPIVPPPSTPRCPWFDLFFLQG